MKSISTQPQRDAERDEADFWVAVDAALTRCGILPPVR